MISFVLCKTFQWINLITDMLKASGTSKKSACDRYRTNFWLSSLANFQKRSNPIAGFDENYYVNNTEATARSIQDLLAEFSAVVIRICFLF
jgi:hypothetical protein